MVQFDGLLPGLPQKMHTPCSPKGSRVLPIQSPEQKIKRAARGWAAVCTFCRGRCSGSAPPPLEEKRQTLAKEKGCIESGKALDSLPPRRKRQPTTKKFKKQRKTRRNVEGRKPAELTTLRVNFSKEVLRPCSLSGFRGGKKKGREKNTEKKTLQLTCGFQTAAAAANEQKQQQNRGKKREKRSSQRRR